MYVNSKLLYIIYTIIQLPIFYGFWLYYNTNKQFRCSCKKFKQTFPLAKASASLINYNIVILICSVLRFYKKYIYIPFHFKSVHYISVFYIYLWSIIHSIAHYVNFQKLKTPPYFSWGVGFTGHWLLVMLMCILIFSLPPFRRYFFHKFIIIHVTGLFLIIGFLYLHQSFCFIKTDNNTCPLPLSWLWITLPFILYICETIYKYTSCNAQLVNYIYHSSNVIELKIHRSTQLYNNITGKIVWICCKNASYFEWHPFAITSLNYSSDSYSIIIKNRGNWTKKVFNQLLYHNDLSLLVYGPFYNLSKSFISHIQHNPTILIASGIGITTFSSVLFKLFTNELYCKLHVIIIVKTPHEIEWIIPTLESLIKYKSTHFSVSFYFTDTTIVNIPRFTFNYSIGRPDIKNELFNTFIYNNFANYKNIYLYHSGNKNVTTCIRNACKNQSYYKFQNID